MSTDHEEHEGAERASPVVGPAPAPPQPGPLRRAARRVGAFLFRPAPPTETAPWWDAGGNFFSILFWLGIGIFVVALFRQKFLPFVDYPQHLALAAILKRMVSSGAPERALYDTNLASFNSMFHVVTAAYHFVLPIERAGEAAIATTFVLTAAGALQLLKVTGMPRGRAFLVMPLLAPCTLAWGFCNYGMSLAIQMFVIARVIQRPRVPRDELRRFDLITALMALVGMWAHLLASMIAYVLMLAAILADMEAQDRPLPRRLWRAIRTGLPLLPAVAYAYWSYRHQPGMENEALGITGKLDDQYAFDKTRWFFEQLHCMRTDRFDRTAAAVGAAILVVSGFFRDRNVRHPPAARWLFPAAALLYYVLPMRLWGTWYIFPRVAVIIGAVMPLFVPASAPRWRPFFTLLFAGAGFASAGLFFQTMGWHREELDDFGQVLDEMPAERRVAGLIFDPNLSSYKSPVLMHFPGYYMARYRGELAFSFMRIQSLPLHFKQSAKPPGIPGRFEWEPKVYKPDTAYARYYDLLLVHSGKPGEDPRARIFGDAAGAKIKVVSHHGRWWVLDTKAGS
jgi:hypothetical protein